MQHHALSERRELSRTLRRSGPDSATLCGDWTTAQLTAHLVLRERSLAEAAGRLPVARFKRTAEQVVDDLARSEPYQQLVDLFERGPSWRDVIGPVPVAWLWSVPIVREQANLLEYLVHHEDVRRAEPGWEPRDMPIAFQQAVWQRLHLLSRLTLRAVPVGLTMSWPTGGQIRNRTAKRGGATVTVTGEPVELAMFAFGRLDQARVDLDGSPADIVAVRGADISL
ncbi:MAG: TIGR03085 family metal-binding protein [Jatrophihabitans sp.]